MLCFSKIGISSASITLLQCLVTRCVALLQLLAITVHSLLLLCAILQLAMPLFTKIFILSMQLILHLQFLCSLLTLFLLLLTLVPFYFIAKPLCSILLLLRANLTLRLAFLFFVSFWTSLRVVFRNSLPNVSNY